MDGARAGEVISGEILSAAFAPKQPRLPRAIVEREILRVVSTIIPTDSSDVLRLARDEVLKWAQKRAGGELPDHAWDGGSFEMLSAGRTTLGASVETEGGLLWSLRGDDPDKTVPGRIWSTEVSLGRPDRITNVLLGVRLIVNSSETELDIEPSVPGLVLQIADKCRLRDGPVPVWTSPHYAESEDHVNTLIGWIFAENRRLPIIIASGDERADSPDDPPIDTELLAKALCGLAHIVSLPAELTYKLSDSLGKELSVFHGGVRIYQPGFDEATNSRDHRLYLGSALAASPAAIGREIRVSIARESLRRTRLGQEVIPFAAVRSTASQIQQEQTAGASESEQLTAALTRIVALRKENEGLRAEVDQVFDLSAQEAVRAEDAEKQLASAWARIEHLEIALNSIGILSDGAEVDPAKWEDFAHWCDKSFSSRLSLAPAARRGVRKPKFEDVGLAARCVRWLVTEARERFLVGGGSLRNIQVFDGVKNAPCGGDEYHFDFQGRRLLANWHIKNGGNTRQPEICLRIYYAFDEITRQVIISDMPAHRETAAT